MVIAVEATGSLTPFEKSPNNCPPPVPDLQTSYFAMSTLWNHILVILYSPYGVIHMDGSIHLYNFTTIVPPENAHNKRPK
jgi:hypothetical protein